MNELIKMLIEQLCILSKDELIWPTTMLVGWLNFVKNQLADQRLSYLHDFCYHIHHPIIDLMF